MDILEAGKAVFIRTVTHHYTGRVVSVGPVWIVLSEAAWIADDGRWTNALTKGELNEVEPYPEGEVLIAIGSVVDICAWSHALPRTVK